MALDDGGSPVAADAIAALWKALRHNGFQRRIPARVRMGDPGTDAEPTNVVHISRGPRRPKRG